MSAGMGRIMELGEADKNGHSAQNRICVNNYGCCVTGLTRDMREHFVEQHYISFSKTAYISLMP
jgi:hypothetical protein